MPHSENLLSQKEVAKRWGCDTSTIARREKDGVIKRALAIPGVWYTRASVERAEGLEGDENQRPASKSSIVFVIFFTADLAAITS